MSMITASVIATVLKPIFGEIYASSKSAGKEHLAKLANERAAVTSVAKRLLTLDSIKTVIQPEKALRLSDFYLPCRFNYNKKIHISIEDINQFPCNLPCVISGTAGQGKSVFLKYLCMTELRRGKVFPIFVQLRRLGENAPNETIQELIARTLEQYGLRGGIPLLNALCESGRLLLLLDGFDELHSEVRVVAANQIQDLDALYPDCKLIVTTRPDTEIERSPIFDAIKIAPLSEDGRKALIRKIYGSRFEETKALLQSLSQNPHIGNLLKTPLLVALLTVTFRQEAHLPDSLPKFYEAVFDTMLVRHDSYKIYTRERKSKLANQKFKKIFEAFCAVSLDTGNSRFSKAELLKYINSAFVACNASPEIAELFMADMVEITCLVINDGYDAYEFIHKNIQEYFSASFVKDLTEQGAVKFYQRIMNNDAKSTAWTAALDFLSAIDRYRFNKYYVIPSLQLALGLTDGLVDNILLTKDSIKKYFKEVQIITTPSSTSKDPKDYTRGYRFDRFPEILWRFSIIDVVMGPAEKLLKHYSVSDLQQRCTAVKEKSTPNLRFELFDIFDKFVLWDEVLRLANSEAVPHLRNVLENAISTLKLEEAVGVGLFGD